MKKLIIILICIANFAHAQLKQNLFTQSQLTGKTGTSVVVGTNTVISVTQPGAGLKTLRSNTGNTAFEWYTALAAGDTAAILATQYYLATHVPTLQQVTTAGNTTTLGISAGSVTTDLIKSNSFEIKSASGANLYSFPNDNLGGFKTIFDNVNLSAQRTLTVPDASGTIALTSNLTNGTVTSIATTSPITGGTITGTGTIAINNAAADGSTKGAASFTAADFNSSSGNISIDYTNSQAATGSQNGFLSATDWTTFNNKLGSIDTLNISNFHTKAHGLFTANTPATITSGIIGVDTTILVTDAHHRYKAETIKNKTFDASDTYPQFNQNTTGSAATLTTPRTINGTSFNGSANITLTIDSANTSNIVTKVYRKAGSDSVFTYKNGVKGFAFRDTLPDLTPYATIAYVAASITGTVASYQLLSEKDAISGYAGINHNGGYNFNDTTGTIESHLINYNTSPVNYVYVDRTAGAGVDTIVTRLDSVLKITNINNLNTDGFIKTRHSDGSLIIDATTYLAATSLGTGVGTALAVNIGSAGAPITFNGAGGTPSSMIGTNITGTASGLSIGGSAATLTTGRTFGITGDLTYTSPSFNGSGNVTAAGTLATVNSNVGTFGTATKTATVTVNGKGLVTAISEQTVTAPVGSITGLGTSVATALGINVGTTGGFIRLDGAGGTPSAMVGTNITGVPLSGGTTGSVSIIRLNTTGTPSATTYLRGDSTWATTAGSSPGGSNTQLQYNNSSSFGGISGATSDGTNLFVPAIYGGSSSGGNHTISSTSHATKGKIIFGSASAYDEVNDRYGLGSTTPLAKFYLTTTSLGTTRDSLKGLWLNNSTAAALGAQQLSPALYWSSFGWATTGSTSQRVEWMADVLPVQGGAAPTSTLQFASSINGVAPATKFSINSAGAGTFTGALSCASLTNGSLVVPTSATNGYVPFATSTNTWGESSTLSFANGLLNVGGAIGVSISNSIDQGTGISNVYRTTSGGSDNVPCVAIGGSSTTGGASSNASGKTLFADITNGYILANGNGTRQVARASIQLDGLANTATIESGGLAFYTMKGGSAMAKRMTIDSTGNVILAKLISTYNNIATVSNGIPSELGTADLTAQTAAKTTTTLYTPTSTGMYRVSIYLQVTTAASTSSVLGGTTGVTITYTDGDGSVAQSNVAALMTTGGAIAITSATNTTATNLDGSMVIYAKTGVPVQYAIDYTSVGVTPMAYAAHLKIEAM